jgi:hypothetical protein
MDNIVEFIEFEDAESAIPFIESVFSMKPYLLSSKSYNTFRIVIENFTSHLDV